jgi:hypothetical protein
MSQQSTWLQRAVLAGTTNEEQQQGQGAPHWSLSAPVCRHCEHHNAVEYPVPADLCGHPDAKLKRNVVTGYPVRMKCEAARQELGLCGPAAMHFVARTADGELSQADAELALGCQSVVSFREPYGWTSSWARRCDSLSSLARSDSIADSSATACSGCARSPNSATTSNQAPCKVRATDSIDSRMNGGDSPG